jgi:hypothetical protein
MQPAFKLYGGTIEASCTATIENHTDRPLDKVPLLLYRMLQVQSVRDAAGKALPFSQTVVSFPELPRKQANVVEVFLPTSLPGGAAVQVYLQYSGPVCGYTEVWPYQHDHVSAAYTLLRRDVLWFPVVGRSSEDCWRGAFTFDLSITVPPAEPDSGGSLIAVSHGEQGERCTTPEGHCYRWHSATPTRPLTVACAPFCREAISADVVLYYLPEDEVGAQVVAQAMRRTRELCSAWFGPMPAGNLRIVEIPRGWGSEASPTLILQTSDAFQAESLDDRDAYRHALSRAGHELIHLWDTPSAEEHVSRFLDEGITQYLEALLLRHEVGEEAYWKRLNDYRSYFGSDKEAAAIPLAEAGQHRKVREVLSRGKGPWLMCVLHHLLDERMIPTLRTFFDRYREQGATLENFEATMTEAADADLSAFFKEWLWGTHSSTFLAQETPGLELVRQVVARYT